VATRFTKITLGSNDDGRRVDRVLRKVLPEVPLSRIYRALRSREVTVNGRRVRGETRVSEGDSLEIADTLRGGSAPAIKVDPSAGVPAEETLLAGRIVYESANLLVVNKLRGELTHGPGSLEEKVRRYLSGIADGVSYRPGPVHRLDRNTSGLVIFGASLRGAQTATEALAAGLIVKRYVAILEGSVTEARWEDALVRDRRRRVTRAGEDDADRAPRTSGAPRTPGTRADTARLAVTRVEPVVVSDGRSLVMIRIETGRTHQIRAQAAHHGHPLLGDRKYGSVERGHYFLHAASLTAAASPTDTAAAGVEFTNLIAPLPEHFRATIVRMFGPGAIGRLEAALARTAD
jgi:23S rRNA pseudouridine955/2504/2580 synthase